MKAGMCTLLRKLRSDGSWSWLLLTRFKASHVCKSIRKLSNREQSWLDFSIILNTLLLHVTLLSYIDPSLSCRRLFHALIVHEFVTWKSHGLRIQSNAACLIWLAKKKKKRTKRQSNPMFSTATNLVYCACIYQLDVFLAIVPRIE